jgi:hypothetical protein
VYIADFSPTAVIFSAGGAPISGVLPRARSGEEKGAHRNLVPPGMSGRSVVGWFLSVAVIGVAFFYDTQVANFIQVSANELLHVIIGSCMGLSGGFVVHALSER